MTTPSPPEFSSDSAAGSRLFGANQLQQAIDALTTAVNSNTQALQQAGSNKPGGTSVPYGNTGQSFTSGAFPKMAAGFFSGSGGKANATTGGPGGSGSGPADTLQAAGGAAMATFGQMITSAPQFSNQVMMNQFASMSTLGMGRGNVGQQQQQMYRMAFGNYNSNLNALASNPADAAQMYSNLQGIAASPFVMSTAQGRAGFGGAAGFGYANPSLGGAGASAAAAQLYSGQTSMAFRQLGYGGTPRASMGQQNPLQMGQVVQSILRRAYGGQGSVGQGTLNAGLANNGKLQLNLQALGLDPSTMGPALQMYNKMFQQGLNPQQAQTLLNAASKNQNVNGQSAQKTLSDKYGIATSDLQKLKDTTAVKTGTTSGEMSGFDSAVSQATTSLQKFDMVLNNILKVTGLGTAIGSAHGFSGVMGSVGGAVGGMFKSTVGMLTRFGGAAGAAQASTGHGSPGSTTGSQASGSAAKAIKDAESQVGRPYVWGGDNPAVGFDCSGLIEWAYGQAGVKLPRTSQEQWAALQNRSVSMDKVTAGDILFSAGSDGTPNNPGHEAMAISPSQIIEAPYTGANIRIRALNKGEWSHAGRPSGNMTGGGTSGSNGSGPASTNVGSGNAGLGLATGNYGSSDELSNTGAALLGGITGGSGMAGFGSIGNGQGSTGRGGSGGGNTNVSTAGGGSSAANRALGQKMAKQMYGWTGGQWNALDTLWGKYESGWRSDAKNPGSSAYGIAQFLDSTWQPYGAKTSSPGLQIKYGLEYIHGRYQNPVKALAFELSHNPHWYDAGTASAAPGMALVGERGPELVKLGGGQQIMNAAKTAEILKGSHAKPAQAPWSSQTARDLFLAPVPQNYGHRQHAGRAEVHLNMPPGAIVVHSSGSSSDVSSNVRTIMQGITEAMADNEMVQKIMAGVMG